MPDLTPLLWPRAIAIVGASDNKDIIRGRLLHIHPDRPRVHDGLPGGTIVDPVVDPWLPHCVQHRLR